MLSALFALTAWGQPADTGLSVTFVSRPAEPKLRDVVKGDLSHPLTLTGHAYLIVGVKTNTGVKEEILGFYPSADSLRSIVKGPGMLKAEYRCGPADDCTPDKQRELLMRLSETETSVKVPITSHEREIIYRDINTWNNKEYRLLDQNCQDFIGSIVRDLGYPTPARSPTQTPADYLRALKPLVEQEQLRRQAQQRTRAAEQAARAAQERRDQAEQEARAADEKRQANERAAQAALARQKAAEQAARDAEEQRRVQERAANTIPNGWVPCKCPTQHAQYGKWVQGVLYHDTTIPFCK